MGVALLSRDRADRVSQMAQLAQMTEPIEPTRLERFERPESCEPTRAGITVAPVRPAVTRMRSAPPSVRRARFAMPPVITTSARPVSSSSRAARSATGVDAQAAFTAKAAPWMSKRWAMRVAIMWWKSPIVLRESKAGREACRCWRSVSNSWVPPCGKHRRIRSRVWSITMPCCTQFTLAASR